MTNKKPDNTSVKKKLKIGEVAKLLNITKTTLRRWDASGRFKSNRHLVTGHRYYYMNDIIRFMRDLNSKGTYE